MSTNRPLSPHLTIYKPQITSSLSIFHRISGAFLASMLLLSVFFLRVCELSLSFFLCYQYVFTMVTFLNWLIFSLANLALLAVSYHMSNGIRHLLWDLGIGLDLSKVYISGMMVIVSTLLLFIIMGLRIWLL